jgi:hypothetical protein
MMEEQPKVAQSGMKQSGVAQPGIEQSGEERSGPASRRRVFLLTMWQEPGRLSALPQWRFRLEDPHTGHGWCFANAAAVVLALLRGVDEQSANDPSPAQAQQPPSDMV